MPTKRELEELLADKDEALEEAREALTVALDRVEEACGYDSDDEEMDDGEGDEEDDDLE